MLLAESASGFVLKFTRQCTVDWIFDFRAVWLYVSDTKALMVPAATGGIPTFSLCCEDRPSHPLPPSHVFI